MIYKEAQRYWIWLSSIAGLGRKNFERLMEEYGEAKYVWEQLIVAKRILPEKAFERLKAARTDEYMNSLFARMEEAGITALTPLDEQYPDRLRCIEEAPHTLYVRGSIDLNGAKMFAIVGSRRITQDGRRFVREIAHGLAEAGVTVVSGLAMGADTRAHEGCLDGGGRTIAVLASGPDNVSPRENLELAERILAEDGSILSEYPPGVHPDARFFPRRNRIISGLSDGVLMTEGKMDSGAMITVRWARSQGRPCFAVPGSIYSLASEGPNRMLVDGDIPVLSAREVLNHFGWSAAEEQMGTAAPVELPELDETSAKLVDLLRYEEKSFGELIIDMKMNSSSLNSLLTILEMQGIIRQSAGKMYRAIV